MAGDAGAGKTTLCTQFLCRRCNSQRARALPFNFGGPSDLQFNFASSYEFVKRTYFGKEIYYVELEAIIEKAGRSNELVTGNRDRDR